jgi:hypothetical protein
MHQSQPEPSSKHASQDAEQSVGKVVRLMPRRPVTEQDPKPPMHDDDDPGPSAA